MDGSFVRKLGLVTGGLLLSALSALVMEWWMSMSTPGAVAVYYLFNPGGSGPVNASLVIATHLGTDFVFCFAILASVYLFIPRIFKRNGR
jgi:hypothetical protein